MTRRQAEQIARIIYNVFEYEDVVDPRTIAKMFQYMGRIGCSEDLNEIEMQQFEEMREINE